LPGRRFQMHAKSSESNTKPKTTSVSHGYQHELYDKYFHRKACKHSEEILKSTWQEKDRIRHTYQTRSAPFTRIERAFMASTISVNTSTEMDQDEMKAKMHLH
jgi:hypothetical protein